jgi:hypothetical protein
VQNDIANLFSFEQPLAQTSPEGNTGQKTASAMSPEKPGQQQVSDEADQLFIYGNPFDGELPEVFYHDEVLKRELKAQLSEQHKPNPPGNRRPQ